MWRLKLCDCHFPMCFPWTIKPEKMFPAAAGSSFKSCVVRREPWRSIHSWGISLGAISVEERVKSFSSLSQLCGRKDLPALVPEYKIYMFGKALTGACVSLLLFMNCHVRYWMEQSGSFKCILNDCCNETSIVFSLTWLHPPHTHPRSTPASWFTDNIDPNK